MNKIFTVAAREFIETVKTKTFFISCVVLPMLMLGMIFGTEWIAETAGQETMPTKQIGVVDQTSQVFDILNELVEQENERIPSRTFALEQVATEQNEPETLRKRVLDGELYAYLIIPPEVLSFDALAEAATSAPAATGIFSQRAEALHCEFGRKDSNPESAERLKRLLNAALIRVRFAKAEPPIDYNAVQLLQQRTGFLSVDVATGQETVGDDAIALVTPFAFMFLLFMGTMTISQGLLTSVIEEKSSRVVEVLLSAVSPTQLMAGKIVGLVGVGALLLGIWGAIGYFGAQARDVGYLVSTYRLTYLVLYFVPGFLFMSAFLAAIGAACNTVKEAQSMAAPLTLLTVIPVMLWWLIMLNPSSTISIVLSYIPPITPAVMILRVCADPEIPLFDVIATQVLLWISVIAMIWAAGKIFRIGVLMYGKPPTPLELIRWLSYE